MEVAGREVAEIGPGAIVGERGAPEGRIRSARLHTTTRARVAEASPHQLRSDALEALARTHRREEPGAVDVHVQTPPSTPVVRVDLDLPSLARYGIAPTASAAPPSTTKTSTPPSKK